MIQHPPISDTVYDYVISEGINDHLLNPFFCWDLISAIFDFLYRDIHVSYRGFGLWIKIEKCELLYWDVHNIYMEKSKSKKK